MTSAIATMASSSSSNPTMQLIRHFAEASSGQPKFTKIYLVDNKPWPTLIAPNPVNFRKFIINILTTRGNVKSNEAEKYTDELGMNTFSRAFTHSSAFPDDPVNNYEILEHLGDAVVNKNATWYLKNRFPDIIARGSNGVQYLSLQQKLITSKPFLSQYSIQLGLSDYIIWRPMPFIYANEDMTNAQPKHVVMDRSMREDVFEAFFSAIEEVIDQKENVIGIGGHVTFSILSSFFDQQNIPTLLSELKDYVTQLKETFDTLRKYKSSMKWHETNDEISITMNINQLPISMPPPNNKCRIDIYGNISNVTCGPYSLTVSSNISGGDYKTSKKIVKQIAAHDAQEFLKTYFGIYSPTYVKDMNK